MSQIKDSAAVRADGGGSGEDISKASNPGANGTHGDHIAHHNHETESIFRGTAEERRDFLVRMAESHESAREHWEAAKVFRELMAQGWTYLANDGGLDSIVNFRLAKNLFLDFKHEAALHHFEVVLTVLSPRNPADAHKWLEVLRMVAVSYEVQQHLREAHSTWEEILLLFPHNGTSDPVRAYAAYQAGRLAERSGDYAGALQHYIISKREYEHLHDPEHESAQYAGMRANFSRLHLDPDAVYEVTYSSTPPSFDVRRSNSIL